MRKIKVRIIGSETECAEILDLLRTTDRVKRCRKIDRTPVTRTYSRTFGSAESIYYVEMSKKNKVHEENL
jgi:hypothetical protein